MCTLGLYDKELMLSTHGILNHERDDTSSRTHHILYGFSSCEYACAFSNVEIDENASHTSFPPSVRFLVRVRTHVDFQTTRFSKTLRKRRTRALSFSSLLS